MTLLLHAITPLGHPEPDETGLRGYPLAHVDVDGLSAWTTELGERVTLNRQDLATAHAIVLALWESGSCLPARLPTWVDSPQALRTALESQQDLLARSLAEVGGQAELALTLLWDGTQPRQQSASQQTPETPGRAYLQRRQQEVRSEEELRGRAERIATDLTHDAVGPTRLTLVPSEGVAFSLALLTTRESASETRSRLQARLLRHPGVRSVWNGPWPPYSFASAA